MRAALLVATAVLLTACPPPPEECAIGAEGCPCTAGGACDDGLRCFSNLCVEPPDSGRGEWVVPGDWIEVIVGILPASPAGDTVYALAIDARGEVVASTSAAALQFAYLRFEGAAPPFDVVVHIPASPAWAPGDELGAGDYAYLRGVTALPRQLAVERWTDARPGRAEPKPRATARACLRLWRLRERAALRRRKG